MKDPVYRLLRCKVQALVDRDAPHAAVVTEVDWERGDVRNPMTNESRVVVIAREDLDGSFNVWNVGFIGTEPSSLNDGRYGTTLTQAAIELQTRLRRR